MLNSRKFRQLFLGLFLLSGSLAAVELKSLSEAVNMAGKQRMYTQRMLKDYVMIGMHNHFADPEGDLKEVMREFEVHLKSLMAFNKEENTKKSLEKMIQLWDPAKHTLLKTPQKEKVAKLQGALELLLGQADVVTKLFAKQTGRVSGEIINISGRQRMLSQRMASLYMLKVWGIHDPMFQEKMDDAMKRFKASLEKLLVYEKNTEEIHMLLEKVEKSFMFFEFSKKFIPTLIYKKSNDILRDMNRVTELYVALEARK